ncbi:TRAP transporter large permease [Nocardiopsis synnemataformans]|uniref:TRAP transporter large permease n=1 Tax=Nocardiopsis synnemataformans TaxID=61305 RepID=UPI003EB6EBC3
MLEILLPTALLLVLLTLGTPVGFAMIVTGLLGIAMIWGPDAGLALLATGPRAATQSFTMTAIPLFILMAEFLGASTVIRQMFGTARAWLGRLPGGLAVASVGAGAGMGALSGSSIAATASLAGTTVPEMRKSGYSEKLALGAVASAGTLAPMIPPSLVLIIYGVTTETSIADLFTAGIIPGLVLAFLYCLVIAGWQLLRPEIAPKGPKVSWSERFRSLTGTAPALLLIALVLGGIYSGLVTATEAGALGALGALVVGAAFGGLRREGIVRAMRRTIELTATLFIIIIGAKLFTQYVTLTGMTQSLSQFVQDAGFPPLLIILIIMLVYIALGAFLDSAGMMLLTLPVFFPLVVGLGYDPVWFGILVALTCEVGLLSPPVGMNVYVTVASGGGRLGDGFRGVTPFYGACLVMALLLVAFPDIATFLPSLSE